MMTAVTASGEQITAAEAVKGENYFCTVCGSKLTFKSGSVKVAHFSHFQIIDCIRYFYKKESIEHLKAKHDLYLMISPYLNVAMEYYLADIEQIPDLLVNHKIALEIQLSRISPTLIAERTKGYHSSKKDVIWILNNNDIKVEGEYCTMSHFHLSTMLRGVVTAYDMESGTMYQYQLHHHVGGGKWRFDKHKVTMLECLQLFEYKTEKNYVLSKSEVRHFIKKERQKHSVLNPTLSFMYRLGITIEDMPTYITAVTPMEKFILNPPLEWKLYLMYHLTYKTFSIEDFTSFIELRVMIDMPHKNIVIKQLLNNYILLYNSQ